MEVGARRAGWGLWAGGCRRDPGEPCGQLSAGGGGGAGVRGMAGGPAEGVRRCVGGDEGTSDRRWRPGGLRPGCRRHFTRWSR